MGMYHSIKCRNKECRYSTILYYGTQGIGNFKEIYELEKSIRDGKVQVSDKIIELLENGNHISANYPHLCNVCHEYVNVSEPYIMDVISRSEDGRLQNYSIHYVFNTPHCKKCHSELQFMTGLSDKCPKCGSDKMIKGGVVHKD